MGERRTKIYQLDIENYIVINNKLTILLDLQSYESMTKLTRKLEITDTIIRFQNSKNKEQKILTLSLLAFSLVKGKLL